MAKGILNIQAADGAVIGLHVPDGLTSGERPISLGVNLSGITAYHLLQGNLAVSASTITQGFNTTLYTSGSATTGIDMNTQWGNTAEEKFGGLVWLKDRVEATNNFLYDTVRGATKEINSNTTEAEATLASGLTAFNSTGFTVGADTGHNSTTNNMVSWNFQTTHRVTGTTNHGKAYTCHFNPFTGFTIVKYEGSGIAEHEIPHHLGREFNGLVHTKSLTTTEYWDSRAVGYNGNLNTTSALNAFKDTWGYSDTAIVNDTTGDTNTLGRSYIMYGWTNSYFDEANKLIGNYEVGVYQGTGAIGNKITTRGKPAWVMIKRVDSTGSWAIMDNTRITNGELYANTSASETSKNITIVYDGFTCDDNNVDINASGGQYLYMVAYDTNSNGGGTYYPLASDTANVQVNNALIPIAQGIDSNGVKNTILSKNETITGLTYTQGKNYVYCDKNGSYGVSRFAPQYNSYNGFGDYFDVNTNKWYSGISLISDDFNTDTGWIINGGATKAIVNGKLKLTTTTTALEGVSKTITTVVGKKYKLVGNVYSGNYVGHMWVGTALNTGNLITTNSGISTNVAIEFVASTTTTYISLFPDNGAIGKFATFDNVAIYPINNDGSVALSNATEITKGRNYLNNIVYADNDGGVLYVEELPKIEYRDIVKANEFKGKNACTAWVNFDGTTTPPTIRDSYNIDSIVRTGTGIYDVYFKEPMSNTAYSLLTSIQGDEQLWVYTLTENYHKPRTAQKVSVVASRIHNGGEERIGMPYNCINIFGGKN